LKVGPNSVVAGNEESIPFSAIVLDSVHTFYSASQTKEFVQK